MKRSELSLFLALRDIARIDQVPTVPLICLLQPQCLGAFIVQEKRGKERLTRNLRPICFHRIAAMAATLPAPCSKGMASFSRRAMRCVIHSQILLTTSGSPRRRLVGC